MFIWREFALFSDLYIQFSLNFLRYTALLHPYSMYCVIVLREPPRQGKAKTTTLDNEILCTRALSSFSPDFFFFFQWTGQFYLIISLQQCNLLNDVAIINNFATLPLLQKKRVENSPNPPSLSAPCKKKGGK